MSFLQKASSDYQQQTFLMNFNALTVGMKGHGEGTLLAVIICLIMFPTSSFTFGFTALLLPLLLLSGSHKPCLKEWWVLLILLRRCWGLSPLHSHQANRFLIPPQYTGAVSLNKTGDAAVSPSSFWGCAFMFVFLFFFLGQCVGKAYESQQLCDLVFYASSCFWQR